MGVGSFWRNGFIFMGKNYRQWKFHSRYYCIKLKTESKGLYFAMSYEDEIHNKFLKQRKKLQKKKANIVNIEVFVGAMYKYMQNAKWTQKFLRIINLCFYEENRCDVKYTWRLSFTFLLHSRSTGIPTVFLKLTVRPFQKIGPKKIKFLRNWRIYLQKYVWRNVWWRNYEFSISYVFTKSSSNLKRSRQWRMGIPYCYNEASVKDL